MTKVGAPTDLLKLIPGQVSVAVCVELFEGCLYLEEERKSGVWEQVEAAGEK